MIVIALMVGSCAELVDLDTVLEYQWMDPIPVLEYVHVYHGTMVLPPYVHVYKYNIISKTT